MMNCYYFVFLILFNGQCRTTCFYAINNYNVIMTSSGFLERPDRLNQLNQFLFLKIVYLWQNLPTLHGKSLSNANSIKKSKKWSILIMRLLCGIIWNWHTMTPLLLVLGKHPKKYHRKIWRKLVNFCEW